MEIYSRQLAAPKGNEYYKVRSKDGRTKQYTPLQFLEKANEYFQWSKDNPLKEELVFHSQGIITKTTTNKKRPYSIEGLCLFAEIVPDTFRNYSKHDEYFEVCTHIRNVIETQQFEGATTGFFNHAIIARKLGLADRKDITSGGEKIQTPILTIDPLNSEDKSE